MKKSPTIHQRGATAILLAVLVLSVIMIIGLGISTLLLSQVKMSSQTGQSVLAFYAAEAGAERCLYEVRKGGAASCNFGTVTLDNSAAYNVTFGSNQIISTGSFGQTSRRIGISW